MHPVDAGGTESQTRTSSGNPEEKQRSGVSKPGLVKARKVIHGMPGDIRHAGPTGG